MIAGWREALRSSGDPGPVTLHRPHFRLQRQRRPIMTLTTEDGTLPTRVRWLLRWGQRLLIITGTLALGYVGFTLLDARLYQVAAKRSLENQIHVEEKHQELQPKPAVKTGDVLGRVDIPRLGISVAVLQGTSSRTLRLGVGHIEGTPLPGETGNTGIAGHRDTFFRELKDIRTNDAIQLQTATELLHYEVDWVKVVDPDDITVLEPSSFGSTLTLVTCYPFHFVGSAPKRFVVRAHRY
jgi:sortase A